MKMIVLIVTLNLMLATANEYYNVSDWKTFGDSVTICEGIDSVS